MAIFDRSVAFHHTGEDPEILEEILRMFLEQGPERMAKVEAALARAEAKELERESHGLKGAAATLGMEPLRVASYAVERLAGGGCVDEAAPAVAAMRVAMDAAVAAVRKELP